jgi:hypothetical protein
MLHVCETMHRCVIHRTVAYSLICCVLLSLTIKSDGSAQGYTTGRAKQYWKRQTGHENGTRHGPYEMQVEHCLHRIGIEGHQDKPHKLAIVMSAGDTRRDNVELQRTSAAWEAYAQHNQYTFEMIWLPERPTPESGDMHFFTRRWAAILASSAWKQHQWVMGIDGDTLPRAMNATLEPYFSLPEDVVLHARMNGEVAAAAVLLRTSAFAECFLRTWVAKGYYVNTVANWDNGDLLQTVLEFAAPAHAKACQHMRTLAVRSMGKVQSYSDYIMCFSETHTALLELHMHMPIRVFAPLQGFLRFHEGKSDMDKPESEINNYEAMHLYCWPGDVVLHGYKRLGQDMWNADTGVPSCRELSADKRLETAKASCMHVLLPSML